MNNGDLKKRLPWYAVAASILGIITALYALGMSPWLPKKETCSKQDLYKSEDQQNRIHDALIQRIERTDSDAKEFRVEQRKFNDKMGGLRWQILKELKYVGQNFRQRRAD